MLLKNSLIYSLLNASGHRSENIGDNRGGDGVCAAINPWRQDFTGVPILLKSTSTVAVGCGSAPTLYPNYLINWKRRMNSFLNN